MAKGVLTGLAHIGVMTSKIEESVVFYRDTLGMTLEQERSIPNGMKLAFLRAGNCVVELVSPADPKSIEDRTHGIVDHICFEVQNINELAIELAEKGVELEGKPEDVPVLGVRNFFAKGPNGERLEFFQFQ